MSQYFPKPYEPFGGDIKVEVDLSNYATKADIKILYLCNNLILIFHILILQVLH